MFGFERREEVKKERDGMRLKERIEKVLLRGMGVEKGKLWVDWGFVAEGGVVVIESIDESAEC